MAGDKDGEDEDEGVDAGRATDDAQQQLFAKGPTLVPKFKFRKGALVAVFKEETKTWEMNRRDGMFAVRIMRAHMQELVQARRGLADLSGEDLNCGAHFARSQGVLRVIFPKPTKEWVLPKLELRLALGYMATELSALPLLKE